MTTTPNMANILSVYGKANRAQVHDGMSWYDTAHRLALSLDPNNVLRAAGVVSALSPQTSWDQNVKLAKRAYAGDISGHTGVVLGKVRRILDGEDVVTVLNAPKTVNFALTIADPSHRTAVVIDRHAVSIALGEVTEVGNILGRKGAYERFADEYRKAAKVKRISPAHMQAVTWVYWTETEIRTAASIRRSRGR